MNHDTGGLDKLRDADVYRPEHLGPKVVIAPYGILRELANCIQPAVSAVEINLNVLHLSSTTNMHTPESGMFSCCLVEFLHPAQVS